MSNEIFETPRRRKMTADYNSDRRYKYSTIDSRMSRDSKVSRESQNWSNIEKVRQNRLNSLFKVRKSKLEQITGENRKIFVRINEQQSYYPVPNVPPISDKAIIKYNASQERMLGPIGGWQGPACFISGTRGIMCEQNSTQENIITRLQRKKLPSISRGATPDKENRLTDFFTPQSLKTTYGTPNRKREISDLYTLI